MALYSITYDLVGRKDYPRLYKAIREVCDTRCARPTESQWIVQSNKTASEILQFLMKHTDNDDVILVIEVDNNSRASVNMNKTALNWLNH